MVRHVYLNGQCQGNRVYEFPIIRLDCCSSKPGDTLQHELILHVLGEVTMVISQPNG